MSFSIDSQISGVSYSGHNGLQRERQLQAWNDEDFADPGLDGGLMDGLNEGSVS